MFRQMVWTALLLALSGSSAACGTNKVCGLDGGSADSGPVSDSCPGALEGDFTGKCDEFKLGLKCLAGDGPSCRCTCEQCGPSKEWVCVELEPNADCGEE